MSYLKYLLFGAVLTSSHIFGSSESKEDPSLTTDERPVKQPSVSLESKPVLKKKSYDDSDLERIKRYETLGKTLPMIEPLRFERSEVQLNAFLRLAPSYVRSFFNKMLSSVCYPQAASNLTVLPYINSIKAGADFNEWRYSYFSDIKKFTREHLNTIMTGISKLKKPTRDALFNFFMHHETDREITFRILAAWPDQDFLKENISISWEPKIIDQNFSLFGLALLTNSLNQGIKERAMQELLKRFDSKNFQFGSLILASSFFQDHDFPAKARRAVEDRVREFSQDYQIEDEVFALLDSTDLGDNRLGRELALFLSQNRGDYPYPKLRALKLLLVNLKFKEQGIVEIINMFDRSADKKMTGREVLENIDDPQIRRHVLTFFRDYVMDRRLDMQVRAETIRDFLNPPAAMVDQNAGELQKKGKKYIERILSSDETEENKLTLIKVLTQWSMPHLNFSEIPNFLEFQEKLYLNRDYLVSVSDPIKLADIMEWFLSEARKPDFHEKRGVWANRIVPDLLQNGLFAGPHAQMIPKDKVFKLVSFLAQVDFSDLPPRVWPDGPAGAAVAVMNAPTPLNIFVGSALAQTLRSLHGWNFPAANPEAQSLKDFMTDKVRKLKNPNRPKPMNPIFVADLFGFNNMPAEMNALKMEIVEYVGNMENQDMFIEMIAKLMNQYPQDEAIKAALVDRVANRFQNFNLRQLSSLAQNMLYQLPQELKDRVLGFIIDKIDESIHLFKKPLPAGSKLRERNLAIQGKKDAQSNLKSVPSLMNSIMYQVVDVGLKNRLKEIAFSFGKSEEFGISAREKMQLLDMLYNMPESSPEEKETILQFMKAFLRQSDLPLTTRHEFLEFNYKHRATGHVYETAFVDILSHMLNFEHNISGGHAMVANVHDKSALNEANVFLKKLLEEESGDRRVLTDEQQAHMLDNVTRILSNLSVYVKEVLSGASVVDGVDYLEKAKARVQIMKISKAATPESAEGMQWYRNANSAEIVIQDHNRRPITQGRALQLAYDAMLKHAPDTMKYQDSLVALIQILGSDEAMNGCAEGAIGGLLRATKPSHSDDKVVAEKFTTEQGDVLRKYQLPQLKNLMVFMLDSWKFNRRVFSQKIRMQDYPSLSPEFMSLISKENHVMDQFLKVSNEQGRTLGTLGWDTILRGLGKRSVRKLFMEGPKSPEEEKIRNDIETLLITPAIRAFIYGQYKPYLVNGSLNLTHYVDPDFVESIPIARGSVRKDHAARKIQSLVRGKQARKQTQRIKTGGEY